VDASQLATTDNFENVGMSFRHTVIHLYALEHTFADSGPEGRIHPHRRISSDRKSPPDGRLSGSFMVFILLVGGPLGRAILLSVQASYRPGP
jgi:hypothetical protein